MKKIIIILLLCIVFWPVSVQAQVLFEHTERTYITRNVVYELNRQVTTAGFLDVHTLTVPLNDPNITVAPVESQQGLGLRETALALLTNAGAVGGVNADFFGLAGTHTLGFGPVIADGELLSINHNYNQGSNEFATFFLDENNFPMIRYITPRIWLGINGIEKTRVGAINKVANVYRPLIINRHGMETTTSLSERFPTLHKVMVEDGIITETRIGPVVVPENGFVIVMNHEHFVYYRAYTWIGMYAQYEVFTTLGRNLSEIQAAVGGGGFILQHGQTVHDTGTAIPGRHPRTALGISGDFNSLILMVVDGRGHSVGASHEDLANLMRRHGATEAMHFDGGGSSTMVAQVDGRDEPMKVVNRVSDGSQRRIINALGVFDSSMPGELYSLVFTPEEAYATLGSILPLEVYGLDANMHRVAVNFADVTFSPYTVGADGELIPAGGTWNGLAFIPDRPGELYIRAQYGDISASKTFLVQEVVSLRFTNAPITTGLDGNTNLVINGMTDTGRSTTLGTGANLQFSVTPESLGTVENGVFRPSNHGVGRITVSMGNLQASLAVAVGMEYFDRLENAAPSLFTDPLRTSLSYANLSLALPGAGALAYSTRWEHNAAILQMTAYNGGIFGSDRSQWGRFIIDIETISPSFVIIRMDVNPLRRLSRDERELFHQALLTQRERGRMVFVISNSEEAATFSLQDGIRYIDIGNTGNDSTIRFNIADGQIRYDF